MDNRKLQILKNKEKVNFTLPELWCERCNHKWFPRKLNKPRTCPKCGNPYWDVPRKKQNNLK